MFEHVENKSYIEAYKDYLQQQGFHEMHKADIRDPPRIVYPETAKKVAMRRKGSGFEDESH